MPLPDPQAELERLLRERDELKSKYYSLTRETRAIAKELIKMKRRIAQLHRELGLESNR